jgi:hypothetical protein
MKIIISTLFVLLSLSSFSAQSEYYAKEDASLYPTRGLRHVPGMVQFGQFLNCEVMNHSSNDLKVSHYYYNVTFRDRFGRMQTNTERVSCAYNCDIDAFSFQLFTGPRNYANIYDATCGAYVRYDRRDRHPRH